MLVDVFHNIQERNMNIFVRSVMAATLMGCGIMVTIAYADDKASLVHSEYATWLRTPEMMHMIDANKTGKISKEDWVAYHTRMFKALDKDGDGFLEPEEFYGKPKPVDFATGGYSTALETKQMFGRIDANGDGKVSLEEYLKFQNEVFGMMDTHKKGELSAGDFIKAPGAR
jgi:Ca2+-binding EF-hand superfamily protein